MRTKIKNYIILPLISILLSVGFYSCDDANDWGVDGSHDRLFSPIDLQATIDGTQVTFAFKKTYESGLSYTLEISQDSLQFTQPVYGPVDIVPVVNSGDNSILGYQLPGGILKPKKQYSARIKCFREGSNESKWSTVVFTTSSEQILKPIDQAKLTDKSVVIEWNVPNSVTHFMFGPKGNLKRFEITADEKTSGVKTFSSLVSSTEYVAEIYNGNTVDDIRGSRNFITPDQLPEGNIYQLQPGDDLSAIISSQTKDVTIVFPKNSSYEITLLTAIPRDINLTLWGQGAVKPQMIINGNLNLPEAGKTLAFENLEVRAGTKTDGTFYEYLFNQSTATIMESIIFKNCIVRDFKNSPLRLQSGSPVINALTFDNCIVSNIGDNGGTGTYAFIHAQSGKINNIKISNSTFSKIGYSIILHNAGSSESVAIQSCTFYNIIGNTRYFVDYNTYSVSNTFDIRDNIFAKTLSSAATARGIRNAGVKPNAINSFQTSDFVLSANPISGVTDYTKTSADLFVNPDGGNFTIKDQSFAGKTDSGDPRWR